jgi:hypothetical protein
MKGWSWPNFWADSASSSPVQLLLPWWSDPFTQTLQRP